jgi:outer membrane protein assembly factor BamB
MTGQADETSRRRLLGMGGIAALAGLGGCLRLADGEATTSETATTVRDATSDQSGTERPTEGDGESAETESESDPSTRSISGPSAVDHPFVDARNRMAQPSATAPATAPVVDWKHPIEAGLNSRRFSSPLVAREEIVLSNYRDVVAHGRADGSVQWRLSESTIDEYRSLMPPDHREDAIILVAMNARTREWVLVAFEADDGTKRWSIPLPIEDPERPRRSLVDGDRAIVVTGTDPEAAQYSNVFVVDLDARRVRYQHRLADAELNPEDLAVDDDTLLVTTDEAASGVANVVAFDIGERERRWAKRRPIGESMPVLGDDHVYLSTEAEAGSGAVRALSRTDGSPVWQFDVSDAPRTGVTVAHDRVYVVSRNRLYAVDATDGTATWSYSPAAEPRIGAGSSELPLATSDHLLLGCNFGEGEGVVRAVTKAAGELAWTVDLPHDEVYTPFVVDDHLYAFGTEHDDGSGGIYALH